MRRVQLRSALESPRARTLARIVAIVVGTVTIVSWGFAVVSIPDWFARSFATDFDIYMRAAERWSSGEGWYQLRQLNGPYPIEVGDVLYPPLLVYLLIPFRLLGPWLWWMIPAGALAWAVWRHRPAAWAWAVIAFCLAWPYSPAKYVFGNPVIWAAAAAGIGTIWPWPSALVLIKPTVLPFAFFGIRQRHWWVAVSALAIISLPFLADTLRYPQVLLNAELNPIDGRGGPFYSLTEFPLMAIGIVAWLGRRRSIE